MPLDLGDLNQFFDGGMTATVNGKTYRIPPVSGELGLWGRRAAALRSKLGDDPTLEELAQVAQEIGEPPTPDDLTAAEVMLSPKLHAELIADGVDDEMIKNMAGIVYARVVGGDELALAFARGELPNLAGPTNRATRRAAAKAAKKASGSGTTNTAEAATTRKPASGSATTTQKASAGNAKAKATASRGRKS